MTEDQLREMFGDSDVNTEFMDEFLQFDHIPAERRLSRRPDLNAFLLIDKLLPVRDEFDLGDMVTGAEHDEIFLRPSLEQLVAGGITRENVLDLIRCGVRYSDEADGLAMYA